MQLYSTFGGATFRCSHRHMATTTLMPRTSTRHAPGTHNPTSSRQNTCRMLSTSEEVSSSAINDLRKAKLGIDVDPAYSNGAAYLKTLGFNNPAQVARILDIAMNPNSLFIDYAGKRSKNAMARSLSVEKDMQPVIEFLVSKGVSKGDVVKIVSSHPPVLSYSVEGRLVPFWAYMSELGVEDAGAAVAARPSLLGLDVDANLRKIVDYLKSVDTPTETIIKYIVETI